MTGMPRTAGACAPVRGRPTRHRRCAGQLESARQIADALRDDDPERTDAHRPPHHAVRNRLMTVGERMEV